MASIQCSAQPLRKFACCDAWFVMAIWGEWALVRFNSPPSPYCGSFNSDMPFIWIPYTSYDPTAACPLASCPAPVHRQYMPLEFDRWVSCAVRREYGSETGCIIIICMSVASIQFGNQRQFQIPIFPKINSTTDPPNSLPIAMGNSPEHYYFFMEVLQWNPS